MIYIYIYAADIGHPCVDSDFSGHGEVRRSVLGRHAAWLWSGDVCRGLVKHDLRMVGRQTWPQQWQWHIAHTWRNRKQCLFAICLPLQIFNPLNFHSFPIYSFPAAVSRHAQMDGSKYTGNFWCDKHHGDGVEAMQYDGFVGKLPQNVILNSSKSTD